MSNRTAEQAREYRMAHLERCRELARNWARKNRKRLSWGVRNKEKVERALRLWQARNKEKVRAYQAVNDAQRRGGKLVKSPHCQRCGVIGKTEAHHYKGYAKEHWFDIIWICRPCHKFIHRKDSATVPGSKKPENGQAPGDTVAHVSC